MQDWRHWIRKSAAQKLRQNWGCTWHGGTGFRPVSFSVLYRYIRPFSTGLQCRLWLVEAPFSHFHPPLGSGGRLACSGWRHFAAGHCGSIEHFAAFVLARPSTPILIERQGAQRDFREPQTRFSQPLTNHEHVPFRSSISREKVLPKDLHRPAPPSGTGANSP